MNRILLIISNRIKKRVNETPPEPINKEIKENTAASDDNSTIIASIPETIGHKR